MPKDLSKLGILGGSFRRLYVEEHGLCMQVRKNQDPRKKSLKRYFKKNLASTNYDM